MPPDLNNGLIDMTLTGQTKTAGDEGRLIFSELRPLGERIARGPACR